MKDTSVKSAAANPKGNPSQLCPKLIPNRNAHAIPGAAMRLPIPSMVEITAYNRPISLAAPSSNASTREVTKLRTVGANPEPSVNVITPIIIMKGVAEMNTVNVPRASSTMLHLASRRSFAATGQLERTKPESAGKAAVNRAIFTAARSEMSKPAFVVLAYLAFIQF